MNQKERMLNNLPYRAWLDGLEEERLSCKTKTYEYNNIPPRDRAKRKELMRTIVGKIGEEVNNESPFNFEYGNNIEIGENFYSNHNLIILDVGRVKIGDNVQVAPNVSIYTAGHPVHPETRNTGYEYGIDITIGDNVWIGGSVSILPGVIIGDNAVIGAGSVVTKDIPANVIAAGNPCRVIREITEEDRYYYFRDRKFDVDPFT